jgi:hypothetical protein
MQYQSPSYMERRGLRNDNNIKFDSFALWPFCFYVLERWMDHGTHIPSPRVLSFPFPKTSPKFHSGLNHEDGYRPLPYPHPFSLSPNPGARRLILANQKNASLQSVEVGASSVGIAWGEVPANNSEICLPL